MKKLQNDLDTVYRWVSTNNMAFNENKFEALRCGPQDIRNYTCIKTEQGQIIEASPVVKCLGVYLSKTRRF